MNSTGFIIFPTSIGPCGIAWREDLIIGVQVAEDDAALTRARILERFPDAEPLIAPDFVTHAVQQVGALLKGEKIDFSQTPLALDRLPALNRQVYEIILKVPPGETTTYGAIARIIGDVHLSQAIGYALGKNPFPIIVPCHRVLGANGKVGGFSANGGTATKMRLLNIERARTSDMPNLFEELPFQQRPDQAI